MFRAPGVFPIMVIATILTAMVVVHVTCCCCCCCWINVTICKSQYKEWLIYTWRFSRSPFFIIFTLECYYCSSVYQLSQKQIEVFFYLSPYAVSISSIMRLRNFPLCFSFLSASFVLVFLLLLLLSRSYNLWAVNI